MIELNLFPIMDKIYIEFTGSLERSSLCNYFSLLPLSSFCHHDAIETNLDEMILRNDNQKRIDCILLKHRQPCSN